MDKCVVNKCIIDRSKWLRGGKSFNNNESSTLVSRYGNSCCVGFYGLQVLNIPREKFKEENSSVSEMIHYLNRISGFKDIDEKIRKLKIYTINDDLSITDSEREKLLTEAFAKLNCEIEFIN